MAVAIVRQWRAELAAQKAAIAAFAPVKVQTAITPPRVKASSPYDAGSSGRRARSWDSTRLGQNTLLWANLPQLIARSREAIRNSAYASAAIDRFESNVIGTGIQPHSSHPNPKVRDAIHSAWTRWCKRADFNGQNDFYTVRAVADPTHGVRTTPCLP